MLVLMVTTNGEMRERDPMATGKEKNKGKKPVKGAVIALCVIAVVLFAGGAFVLKQYYDEYQIYTWNIKCGDELVVSHL